MKSLFYLMQRRRRANAAIVISAGDNLTDESTNNILDESGNALLGV